MKQKNLDFGLMQFSQLQEKDGQSRVWLQPAKMFANSKALHQRCVVRTVSYVGVFFSFLLLLSHRLTTRLWCLRLALEFGHWQPLLKLSVKGELQHVVKAQSFSSTVIPWLVNCETRQSVSTGRGSVQQFSQATLNRRRLRSHILPQSQTDESIVRDRPYLEPEPGSIQHL